MAPVRLRRAFSLLATTLLAALCGCTLLPERPESIPPPPSFDTPDRGKVGDAITLKGEKTELKVTVLRVLDPAPVGNADTTLIPDARFVGIAVELENIGQAPFSESPLADADLVTDGRPAEPVNLLGGPCGGSFPLHVTLRPNARKQGCIPFEVRGPDRLVAFKFALGSGFAPEIGEWRLK